MLILRKVFKGTLIHWKKCDKAVFIPLKKCNGRRKCICNFCLMALFETTPFAVCSNMLYIGWFEPNPLEILYLVYSSHKSQVGNVVTSFSFDRQNSSLI